MKLAMLAGCVLAGAAMGQAEPGLVASYSFQGNCNDGTGNGFHGAPESITYVAGPNINSNQAALFNGVDSKIRIWHVPIPSNNVFSWSVWLRIDRVTSQHPVIERIYDLGNNLISPGMFVSASGSIQFYTWVNSGFATTSPDGSVSAGRWAHVACTSDLTNVRRVYVNGQLAATGQVPSYGQELGQIMIGYDRLNLIAAFQGALDELRFYSKTLNSDEIRSLFAFGDCNGDGVVDRDQIASGQYPDADNNGRLDICECTAPSITTQPSSQSLCTTTPLSLTVAAGGTAPQFQWRKNGANIAGATNASYTVNSTVVADSGSYDCVVSNACGTVTSAAANVVVRLPQILSQPNSQAVGVDQPVFFAVETNTSSPCQGSLNFQWQRRNAVVADPDSPNAWLDLNEGGGFVGATAPSLVILRPTPGLATGYRCKITNACGCEADANGVIYTSTVNFSAACPSDFNLDGSVDGDDVITFFERWDGGC